VTKAAEAFRNIGELSDELGIKKHVLRFWELKFPQLKPMKRGGGRRLYRPSDVELLKGIRDLLQNDGYTIKGVQKLLREQGVEHVKLAGSAAPAGDAGRRDVKPGLSLVPGRAGPMQLSAEDVAALRSVIAELDVCRALLSEPACGEDGAGARG
jgi:DNA-binding transcriptional MerR regulator